MTRRRKLSLLTALVLALLVGWPVAAHLRARAKLEAYKSQLRAQGEKLTIPELVHVPDHAAIHAGQALLNIVTANESRFNHLASNYPPIGLCLSPALGWAICREPVLPTTESKDIWPALESMITRNEDVLTNLHAVLEARLVGFPLDFSQGYNSLRLSHLSKMKEACHWLSIAAIVELHRDRPEQAFLHLRALTRLGAAFHNEPVLISQTVRISMLQIALTTAWQALQTRRLRSHQWAELGQIWNSIDLLIHAESGLAVERVLTEQAFCDARRSYASISGITGAASPLQELAQLGKDAFKHPADGLRQFAYRYPVYWHWKYWGSYNDVLADAKAFHANIGILRGEQRTPLGFRLQQLERDFSAIRKDHPRAGACYGCCWFLSAGSRFNDRLFAMEIQRSLLVSAIALERHRLTFSSYPISLPVALTDPADGQPLRYALQPDGSFRLYSAGMDCVDNLGDTTREPSRTGWWLAKDAVWPSPAPSAIVQAHTSKLKLQRLGQTDSNASPEALAAFRKRYGLDLVAPADPTNSQTAR